jgi:hypothetical protein
MMQGFMFEKHFTALFPDLPNVTVIKDLCMNMELM